MTLPLYMLRRLATPGGVRLKKATPLEEFVCLCPTCKRPVIKKKMMSAMQTVGTYWRDSWYHFACVPPPSQEWKRIYSSGKTDPPKGNLGMEEYRFWVGFRDETDQHSICRACRANVYGAKGRAQHFMDEKYYLGGEPCSTRLVNAYKEMLNSTICMICKKQRFGYKKWGIPICESDVCQTEWKFDVMRWAQLEVVLDRQRKRALILNDASYSKVTQVGEDKKEFTRIYCRLCQMFLDNAAHDEIHAAHIMSGGEA